MNMVEYILATSICIFLATAFGEKNTRNYDKEYTIGCLDALASCRKKSDCKNAFRTLNKKCKVISGRCDVQKVDLFRCGRVKDNLFSDHGFPNERCKCDDRNSVKCLKVLNKIYGNPCFESVLQLSSQNKDRNAKKYSPTIFKISNTTQRSYFHEMTSSSKYANEEGRQSESVEKPARTTTIADTTASMNHSHRDTLIKIIKILLGMSSGAAVVLTIILIWIRRRRINHINKDQDDKDTKTRKSESSNDISTSKSPSKV